MFLNSIVGIMGDYAVTAPMETFTANFGQRHPTDLAMLRGARLVTASETEEGRDWAESRIKRMTRGDKIAARFMRQDFFEFVPQFKLTLVGNHSPRLRNVDDAAKRRFNIIPFDNDRRALIENWKPSCAMSGPASFAGLSREAWNGRRTVSSDLPASPRRPKNTSAIRTFSRSGSARSARSSARTRTGGRPLPICSGRGRTMPSLPERKLARRGGWPRS